jgi:hypothetical protein
VAVGMDKADIQGDQIERFFAHLLVILLCSVFFKLNNLPTFLATLDHGQG